jgi:hypothetical protein
MGWILVRRMAGKKAAVCTRAASFPDNPKPRRSPWGVHLQIVTCGRSS